MGDGGLKFGGALLTLALGCGPTVGGTDGGGDGSGDDGSAATDGPGGSGSEGASADGMADGSSGGVGGCGIEQQAGAPILIEVVNNRDAEVRLEGRGCDPPLLLAEGTTPVIWAPDCGSPVCATEPGEVGCGVCDCGQVITNLAPGESTTFEWVGNGYDLVEPAPACACAEVGGPSCWVGTLVAAGSYVATTEFREVCTEPDPPGCDGASALEEASVTFDYPGDSVVLAIE